MVMQVERYNREVVMSRVEQTERRWASYIETALNAGRADVTVPQDSLSLDNAVNLAIRLKVTLILADNNYIFAVVESGMKRNS
jgi:hypothetical protein